MTKKIFLSIITICSLSVVAAIIIVTAILYGASAELAASEVRTDAKLISSAVEQNGSSYLETADIDDAVRVTWIGRDGRVLFDSEEEASELENHSDRKEIQEAVKNGEGSSSRYSATIMQKTVNHAVRLSDGSVIRVSGVHTSLTAQLLKVLTPMLLTLAVLVLFSALAASKVSRNIVKPINDIDLAHPTNIKGYEELAPLLELSDGIVDIVETGTTLKENGLEVIEDICPISARLIVNMVSMKVRQREIEELVRKVREKL